MLLLIAENSHSSSDLANLLLLNKNLAPRIARVLYHSLELTTWQKAANFFALATTPQTTLYRITDLVENIQLAFCLNFESAAETPKSQARQEFQMHIRFMDHMQYNICHFTQLRILSIFISSAAQDQFGLVRVANILNENGPRQPISVYLKSFNRGKPSQVSLPSPYTSLHKLTLCTIVSY